jgi:hypothetical protein
LVNKYLGIFERMDHFIFRTSNDLSITFLKLECAIKHLLQSHRNTSLMHWLSSSRDFFPLNMHKQSWRDKLLCICERQVRHFWESKSIWMKFFVDNINNIVLKIHHNCLKRSRNYHINKKNERERIHKFVFNDHLGSNLKSKSPQIR